MGETLAVQEQGQILNSRAQVNGTLVIPASEGTDRAPESKPATTGHPRASRLLRLALSKPRARLRDPASVNKVGENPR